MSGISFLFVVAVLASLIAISPPFIGFILIVGLASITIVASL